MLIQNLKLKFNFHIALKCDDFNYYCSKIKKISEIKSINKMRYDLCVHSLLINNSFLMKYGIVNKRQLAKKTLIKNSRAFYYLNVIKMA